jgi:dolichol-phosphate mannosyltransferase
MMSGPPGLSVVVPVRNEEENVLPLADEIDTALACLPEWECIWVDDASTDGTAGLLRAVVENRTRHRLFLFDEHRGQTAALLAGWKAARFEFVASLDGDRQNEPADLVRLLEAAVRDRLDMVNGVRTHRHDSWVRLVSSRIANGFRDWVTGDRIADVGCSTRVLRRAFVASLPAYRNMHRFLPTLVRLGNGRVGEAPVGHRPRTAGRTKYGISNRLWTGIADTLAVRWMTRRTLRLDATEWKSPGRESHEAIPLLASRGPSHAGSRQAGPRE